MLVGVELSLAVLHVRQSHADPSVVAVMDLHGVTLVGHSITSKVYLACH